MFLNAVRAVIKQIGLLLVLYALTRILFFVFNQSYFNFSELPGALFYGLRFDFSVIFLLNSILFFILLLPLKFINKNTFRSIYLILFISVNALALLFNCIDIGYFEFIQKRSTFDLFTTMGGENDGRQVIIDYIIDYWYLLLIWIGIIILLIRFTALPIVTLDKISPKAKLGIFLLLLMFIAPLMILGSRGGWQYRPIDMITATNYADGKHVSLILNSPFCIMKSANKAQLEKRSYYNSSALNKYYSTTHHKRDTALFQQKNVVIIILESIGSEYTALANDKASLTPFLDSLSKKSTQFTHAFANGKTSIKGIPAVVAGIPTLFDGSFTYSAYNANNFESVASILKKKGYSSSFFHGGNNGTMGFDVFSKAAGFDKYYGRNEYPNQNDYDGHWGIFDEPFYQFFKSNLDQQKQPFVSCFFSLSSHHPYTVPEKYKKKFLGNALEISASVQYADYALQQFFEKAKKANWYKNTLFVITADHTSMSKNPLYQTDVGIYSIPVLFFDPNEVEGKEEIRTIQQIDIVPSILGKLHYDLPYFAFGNDYEESKQHYAISFNGQYYQLITDKYCLQFDGEKTLAVYDLKSDIFLKNNIIKSIDFRLEEQLLKAIIQTYNLTLIENKMTVKN